MKQKKKIQIPGSMIIAAMVIMLSCTAIAGIAELPPVKQGECVNLRQTCGTCSEMNVSVYSPNSTLLIDNEAMIGDGAGRWTYEFCNTTELGRYDYPTCGDSDGTYTCNSIPPSFNVTPNGKDFSVEDGVLYGFVFLLIGLFLYFSINGIRKATTGAWLIFYICLTYILGYTVMGIMYIVSLNYMWTTPIFEKIFYIIWFIMGIGLLPFIVSISLYILGKEAKANLEEGYVRQGYSRDEAKDLSKKNKR